MSMHPRFNRGPAGLLIDLLFPDSREAALLSLKALGLCDQRLSLWEATILPSSENDLDNTVAEWKLRLDKKASESGLISKRNPESIISNMLKLSRLHESSGTDYIHLRDRSILDFGCGVFYSLSSALLLKANGYHQVYAFEPYPLKVEFVVASLFELILQVIQNPAHFNFSGISNDQLKMKIVELNLNNLSSQLNAFNSRQVNAIDLGGVKLVSDLGAIPNGSLDTVFSNSVLEHLKDFPVEMQKLRDKLKPSGVALHTVDFVDHRYYQDRNLHPFEFYFDGILHEINGIRPREMEQQFVKAGFNYRKCQSIKVPAEFSDISDRQMLPKYASQHSEITSEWVNGYILTLA